MQVILNTKSPRQMLSAIAVATVVITSACDQSIDPGPTPSGDESDSKSEKSETTSSSENPSDEPSTDESPSPSPSPDDTSDEEEESSSEEDASESDDASDDFDMVGKCGVLGEAIISDDVYEGTEEFYMIADKGDGDDLCLVRFEARSVGTPDVECERCEWTFIVELSNPEVITNTDNLCANSERQLDESAIAALDGSRKSYGYVREFAGHEDMLIELDAMGDWAEVARSEWKPATGEFTFNNSHGFCKY